MRVHKSAKKDDKAKAKMPMHPKEGKPFTIKGAYPVADSVKTAPKKTRKK